MCINVCKKFTKRGSLSYVLFHNVQNNLISSAINTKTLVGYQYQRQQRRFFQKSTCNCTLDYFSSEITFGNKSLCIISRRVLSHLSREDSLKKMLNYLPFFTSGEIVAGFGRGSKELGIPTANYPLDVVKSLPDCFQPGVYFGWANVNNGPVYKMVMSIGWNPFYDNKEKSIETHILHEFNRDLYGCLLKVCIVGYLRPEQNFRSVDDLIVCIKNDITQSKGLLETNETYKELQGHQFFLENCRINNDSHTNITNSKSSNS